MNYKVNYTGARDNADVHKALEIVKQYNKPRTPRTVDEAPYSMVSRVKDATKGIVPGSMNRMAKGRVGAGRLANDLNKQYQTFLGQRGHQNQKTQTMQDLTDFFTRFKVDPSAYFAKAGVTAGEPTTVLTKKQSDNVILQVGQAMASSGEIPPGLGGAEDPAAAGKATGTAPATAGTAAAKSATAGGAAGAAFGKSGSVKGPAAGGTATGGETPATDATATGGETPAPDATATGGETPATDATATGGETPAPAGGETPADATATGGAEEPAAPAQKFNNGDEISYITSKGKPQDGIFVQYLDNTDAQGDPQAQVRQPNQTDAQAYAVDAASLGPKGSPPPNNDAARAAGTGTDATATGGAEEPTATGDAEAGTGTDATATGGAEEPAAAGADATATKYAAGDQIQYTNSKGDVNQGNIISGPEQEGTENEYYAIKGVGGKQYNVKASQMQPIEVDKTPKRPGLTPDGQTDVLPSPEGDGEADASQPQFAAQVKVHDQVLKTLATWSQASRDKLKAQLGASA